MKSKFLEIKKEHEQFFISNQIKLNRFLNTLILIDSTLLSIVFKVKEFIKTKFRIFISLVVWIGTYSIIANFVIFPVPKVINFIAMFPIFIFLALFIIMGFIGEGNSPTGIKTFTTILTNFLTTITGIISLSIGFLIFFVIN